MRALYVVVAGLVVAYLLGCFETPLTLVRGSAGEVNAALTSHKSRAN